MPNFVKLVVVDVFRNKTTIKMLFYEDGLWKLKMNYLKELKKNFNIEK